jgi:nucleoside-diphosphate-sugar epimerase
MICVTGANGTLGSEVVRHLELQNAPFRAAYFSSKAADAARARGIEAVIIDYNRPETLGAAFRGCDKLDLERYFREDRASRLADDISQVIGRDARRFSDYVQETTATGVWDAEVERVAR